tara:strand:+ start:2591 stop:3001 length:411 start_codon:yes stop_codon:yes gene_type:complete
MSISKIFLAIGIAIIFTVFIAYGLSVIYEHSSKTGEERQQYRFNTFIILAIIGAIAIVAGMLMTSLESIGSGLLGGGILTILYSVTISWGSLNKYLRLLVLFAILILLIFLGYKKIESKSSKNQLPINTPAEKNIP